MKITYSQNGEHLIPDIQMSQPEHPIGKYGLIRKTFLKEHRRAQYNTLLMTGKLEKHLLEIDREVRRQVKATMEELRKQTPEPDKDRNPLGWIQYQNSLRLTAEELAMPMITE